MKLKTETNRADGFRQRWFTVKAEAESWAEEHNGWVMETSPGEIWNASYFIAPRVQDARLAELEAQVEGRKEKLSRGLFS